MNDFETIFEHSKTGMAIVDKDGIFLKVNPALSEFLHEDVLEGKAFAEFTHPEDLGEESEQFLRLVSGEISSYSLEKRYKVNGYYSWGILTTTSIEGKDYYFKEIQNITKIKIIEEELHNFAYAASHDLREPLRIINGYSYMIKSAVQTLPPTFQHYVSNIINAVNRMSEMIDGLLAYSRVSRANKDVIYTQVDVIDAVKLAKKNLENKITESGAIINIKGKGTICGIKGQIVQLFQNLIDNSIKYSHKERRPVINICFRETESKKQIAVADNGIGIRKDSHDKVFQIFKQLHPEEQGSGRGIGLAIVKQIVDHHGGRIWLESEVNKGTTFYIEFR